MQLCACSLRHRHGVRPHVITRRHRRFGRARERDGGAREMDGEMPFLVAGGGTANCEWRLLCSATDAGLCDENGAKRETNIQYTTSKTPSTIIIIEKSIFTCVCVAFAGGDR